MRSPIKLKGRSIFYVLAALAILVAVTLTGVWRPLDYWMFGQFFLRDAPPLLADLRLVDVPYDRHVAEEREFAGYRKRMASVLNALSDQIVKGGVAPSAIILDIAFTKPSDSGVAPLVAALKRLRKLDRNMLLFGVISPWKENTTEVDPDFAQHHLQDIYELFDSAGHTVLEQHGPLLKYEPRLSTNQLQGDVRVEIIALPILVAESLFRLSADQDPGTLLVPLGAPSRIPVTTATFDQVGSESLIGNPFANSKLAQALIVIGNLTVDVENPYGRPGPELIGWAISDLAVHGRNQVTRYPVNHAGLLIAEVLLAALVAIVLFNLLLRVTLNRWGLARTTLSLAVASVGSIAACLVLLAMFVGGFLMVDRILPVALPALAILLGSAFSWMAADHRIARALGDPAQFIRIFPQRFNYDVFVSYSRESGNADWVRAKIVAPLREATGLDGTALRVFFDQSEIGAGERWEDKVLSSLAASRVFLIVISTDYFEKDYCKLEYRLTQVLQQAKRGPLLFLPVVRDPSVVPEEIQALQYLDATGNANIATRLIERIIAARPDTGSMAPGNSAV